ncbi:sulfotransferase [Streptomyces sp. NPDC054796]
MSTQQRQQKHRQQNLTFIVGTGRSGSTTLSRIVNLHPGVLSLNELFASVMAPRVLSEEPLDGAEFWSHVAGPTPVFDRMIRSGVPLPEFLYPRLPSTRYSAETTGIPAILLMTLPHLSDDPDGLLDTLTPTVESWPVREPAAHWEALFAALAELTGRTGATVERSGYSLGHVPVLRSLFPHARFVHLYRDGPDCALSMSRHSGYRLIRSLYEMAELCGLESPGELTEEHIALLPPELAALLAERFEPGVLMDRPVPVERFGELWSRLIEEGVRDLAALPESVRTTLAYEDLLDDPHGELTRLAAFIGVKPLPEWLDEGSALLDGGGRRGSAARNLSPGELAALREVCAPGERALARQ